MSRDAEGQIRLDATSLRGIAHPLRVRILGLLREYGPSTATRLAERLGQSTGATSYHLRQLATYGFVVEEAGRGAGRERWWRAVHRRTVLDDRNLSLQAPAEIDAYLRSVADAYAERVARWLGERPSLAPEWSQSATLSDWSLWLTPAEAKDLHDQLIALITRYRQDPEGRRGAPDEARRVVAQLQLMPFVEATPEEIGAAPDGVVAPAEGAAAPEDGPR
jgi:predicted ArsR family transcriptional regulator